MNTTHKCSTEERLAFWLIFVLVISLIVGVFMFVKCNEPKVEQYQIEMELNQA